MSRTLVEALPVAGPILAEATAPSESVLAGLSHELRAPLSIIQNYCEILLRCPPQDEARRADFLRTVADEAERLNGLLLDVIEIERLTQSGEALDRRPRDPRQLTERAMLGHEAAAARREITLTVEAPAVPLPTVAGDSRRLVRALTCLVDNAVNFSPTGGHVVARLLPGDGLLSIEIEDDGIGVAPEIADRIFDQLFRGTMSLDPKAVQGSGLGLTLARLIARRHGGDVTYRPTEQGSVFTLHLPVATLS